MRKAVLLLLFAFLVFGSFSQLDYRKMKDTICPSHCGYLDSATLHLNFSRLTALDTALISEGISDYYFDLAELYTEFALANESNDTVFRRLALATVEKYLIYEPRDAGMIWNAAFDNIALGNCDRAHYYLTRFKETAYRKELKEMKEQVKIALIFCPNEELNKKFRIK